MLFQICQTLRKSTNLLIKVRQNSVFGFAKAKAIDKNLNSAQTFTIKDIIDQEGLGVKQDKNMPQTAQSMLSKDYLKRCSPLMQRILSGASSEPLKQAQSFVQKPSEPSKPTIDKHDLYHFRHMLAGPLPNEASFDKFCLGKKCPLILDVKYDGQRTFISYVKDEELDMISRNGKTQRISYDIIKQRIQRLLQLQSQIKSIKMDGEIVVVDQKNMSPLPFAELMKLKNLKSQQLEDWELQMEGKIFLVYIFDVVQYNGENVMTKPLSQRKKLIPNIGLLKPSEYRVVNFPEERAKIFEYFKDVIDRRYQGLILKGESDLYYTNQTRTVWKKLKRGFTNTRDPNIAKVELDLIVMGANRGTGFKNQKSYTSYLLGTRYNGKIVPLSNVGSGFNEVIFAQLTKLVEDNGLVAETVPEEYQLKGVKADVYYKPQLVFQIHAQEFTVSPTYNLGRGQYGGLSLRFPSFKRVREDKGVNEATTGEQILQLSKAFNLHLPK